MSVSESLVPPVVRYGDAEDSDYQILPLCALCHVMQYIVICGSHARVVSICQSVSRAATLIHAETCLVLEGLP